MKQFNLEEYLKNPNREVVTRSGKPVRIICTDRKTNIDFPVIALVMNNEGEEYAENYRKNGSWSWSGSQHSMDLLFAPIKKEGWVNIYRGNVGDVIDVTAHPFKTEDEARLASNGDDSCIATIKIEWEE